MNGARFTAYLSDKERRELLRMAEAQGCSQNYLVRLGLRGILGMPVPRWAVQLLKEAQEA